MLWLRIALDNLGAADAMLDGFDQCCAFWDSLRIEAVLQRRPVPRSTIALGHLLATTGVRLTITVARQLKEVGARCALPRPASVVPKALHCFENPEAT